MKNEEINELITDFSQVNGIQAIVLGGSRATNHFDNDADYDIYIYSEILINQDIRREILSKYSKYESSVISHFLKSHIFRYFSIHSVKI